ncbi:SLC45 family MFS transporter [Aestuariicella hydrocarbonica]|uniref:SLC45 family MFS transporter n=2 Tax=Pseudomaricurvus hydrocarbonicus TaxID=1470433 RepID=A0A9E5MNR5_9GAMM|nr:MFS transporter [Aestuariicella hydrocarbonica]NHO67640.1 SLC45 family MFS transporter [Aestuariicella hydrocarbonica]
MCFGFLGIQFGFALQNANVSRIFQTLGASIDDIPILWVAAPVTGLLVQPIVGYMSDRTWTRLGRRRPYFLYGALLTTLALFFMPHSPSLWIAAGMLWIMDASINISMEPFRAFVGDMLPDRQRSTGFVMQSFFIGVGAVVASALPWMLANWGGISNVAEDGGLPNSVIYSFYAGGVVLLLAVLWTVVSTREYSPEELQNFERQERGTTAPAPTLERGAETYRNSAVAWFLAGGLMTALVFFLQLEKELYILGVGLLLFGGLQALVALKKYRRHGDNALSHIMDDLFAMPVAMKQLAWVQFFSWFALFAMWIYTTSAVTAFHYGTTDSASEMFNEGANWVGVLFAAYNGFAALAAFFIAWFANRTSRKLSHLVNLCLGGLGLISFVWIEDPAWLLLSMVGVGIAWASILSLPYAILSSVLPAQKMGVYMGIFNFFIVIPQILAASILGFVLNTFLSGQAIYALVLGGGSMIVAGLLVLRVQDHSTAELLPTAQPAAGSVGH